MASKKLIRSVGPVEIDRASALRMAGEAMVVKAEAEEAGDAEKAAAMGEIAEGLRTFLGEVSTGDDEDPPLKAQPATVPLGSAATRSEMRKGLGCASAVGVLVFLAGAMAGGLVVYLILGGI